MAHNFMSLNYFFAIVLLTVLVTRLWLRLIHISDPTVEGIRLHHYMYGLILVGIYFIFSSPILLAIGCGLIIDELPLFYIIGGWNWPHNRWKAYNSWQCRTSVVAVLILSYLSLYFFQVKFI